MVLREFLERLPRIARCNRPHQPDTDVRGGRLVLAHQLHRLTDQLGLGLEGFAHWGGTRPGIEVKALHLGQLSNILLLHVHGNGEVDLEPRRRAVSQP